MGFFDFESAEREERSGQPIQGRGDTLRALLDHRWIGFSLLIFLVAVAFRIQELLTLVAFMLTVVTAAWLWSRSALRGIVYHRRLRYRRYFPGEEFEIQFTIENRKLLPLSWFQVEDRWPLKIALADEEEIPRSSDDPDSGYLINTYALRWYERIRRRYTFVTRGRGVFELGPATLFSGDPFSLFDRKYVLENRYEVVIVYPCIRTLPELGLPLKDPFGDKRVQRRLFEDPSRTMGIRQYSERDSFRHIHWKASARTGQLQTRVYEPTRSLRTVLLLNVATFEQYWRGVWPEMLEYELEVAASLANWGLGEGHSVGMSANGTLAHADQPFRIPPSSSPDQLTRILQALAAVSFFISSNYDRFLLEESPRIPWGATLVLLTPYFNMDIAASILRLRDSGRRVVLIVLGKQRPPDIPRVITYHLPIAEAEPVIPPDPDDPSQTNANEEAQLTPRQRYLLRRAQEEAERERAEDGQLTD